MINDLYLLKFSPENASTKQKIISVLGSEWPLTARMIFERLEREYSANISYQGVHKVIKELEEGRIINRNKDGYSLSIDWIQKSKKSMEDLEKQYLHNEKIKLPEAFQGSVEIEFDNTTDLAVSTADLLASKKLGGESVQTSIIACMEYGWWPFKFRFEQFELLYKMASKNPESKFIIRKKIPFGEWISKQYSNVGAKGPPVGTKFDIDEDILIQGDYILEIKFDDSTKKVFEYYYAKCRNIEDIFKEFGLKDEPKIHAIMRITKNPEMAIFLRKQLVKVFGREND